MKYILSIDQGTSSSRALLFNKSGELCAFEQIQFPSYYPQSGWVEQDPEEIWHSQIESIRRLFIKSNTDSKDIHAIGITNQRETIVVWDRHSGKAIYPAIVWQDRRVAPICEKIMADGLSNLIQSKTGLVIDAYFSGPKIQWILENVPGAKDKAKLGDLALGTIDSWLLWKLTGGTSHYTDHSNASRTMLLDIESGTWDHSLLSLFHIPHSMLPEIKNTFGDFGQTNQSLFGNSIPICAMIGDQQAALAGQNCFQAGEAKNTYGTGCFLLMNTGKKRIISSSGLLTTIAWSSNGQITYALEGSVFNAGTAIQWLKDELSLIGDVKTSSKIASSIHDTGGVIFVPAFTGLGSPYWDMYARAAILGISRGTTKAQIIRAALESIAQRSCDILKIMEKEAGVEMDNLKVDGGVCLNNFLMQFQSNLLDIEIIRPQSIESTARGAAIIAGIQSGFFNIDKIDIHGKSTCFYPDMSNALRIQSRKKWKKAIDRTTGWAE